ncbi:hypothetical protein ACFO25_17455 [Paenactinomyces guangxiensis]|uniref:Uncharacterized protein n=1 Tax=Paenactinomyces guangxiensis TaxID=1490290 RepID=A0A7W2A924_9BACL|nr:hypothetical protein [Paenactinomyces guangxiensis]MBA4494747.1 hypothetical protein [Paenactinomyces guangxiensis]MBH8591831.1 hypothetical protein [Paenactinomyces guangxiensis]
MRKKRKAQILNKQEEQTKEANLNRPPWEFPHQEQMPRSFGFWEDHPAFWGEGPPNPQPRADERHPGPVARDLWEREWMMEPHVHPKRKEAPWTRPNQEAYGPFPGPPRAPEAYGSPSLPGPFRPESEWGPTGNKHPESPSRSLRQGRSWEELPHSYDETASLNQSRTGSRRGKSRRKKQI